MRLGAFEYSPYLPHHYIKEGEFIHMEIISAAFIALCIALSLEPVVSHRWYGDAMSKKSVSFSIIGSLSLGIGSSILLCRYLWQQSKNVHGPMIMWIVLAFASITGIGFFLACLVAKVSRWLYEKRIREKMR